MVRAAQNKAARASARMERQSVAQERRRGMCGSSTRARAARAAAVGGERAALGMSLPAATVWYCPLVASPPARNNLLDARGLPRRGYVSPHLPRHHIYLDPDVACAFEDLPATFCRIHHRSASSVD